MENTTSTTSTRRHRLAQIAGTAIAATVALTTFAANANASTPKLQEAVADGTVYPSASVDYDLWLANFGQTSEADVNADGRVDAADFSVWQDHAADEGHSTWIIIQSMSSPIFRSIPEG